MGFWIPFLIGVALMGVVQYFNKPQMGHPAAAEKFDVPTVQPGASIALLRGTRDIKASSVVNYGNVKAIPIKSKGGKK